MIAYLEYSLDLDYTSLVTLHGIGDVNYDQGQVALLEGVGAPRGYHRLGHGHSILGQYQVHHVIALGDVGQKEGISFQEV